MRPTPLRSLVVLGEVKGCSNLCGVRKRLSFGMSSAGRGSAWTLVENGYGRKLSVDVGAVVLDVEGALDVIVGPILRLQLVLNARWPSRRTGLMMVRSKMENTTAGGSRIHWRTEKKQRRLNTE